MTNIEAIKALKTGVELIEYKWEKEKMSATTNLHYSDFYRDDTKFDAANAVEPPRAVRAWTTTCSTTNGVESSGSR